VQRSELEKVKAERSALLASLAALRADSGKSGSELQQEDVALLRREIEAKKDKLNELRRGTRELADTWVPPAFQLFPLFFAGVACWWPKDAGAALMSAVLLPTISSKHMDTRMAYACLQA
jgi:hypothetical protein